MSLELKKMITRETIINEETPITEENLAEICKNLDKAEVNKQVHKNIIIN